MKPVLIFAKDEHTRDHLKAALNNYIPLIVTEDAVQCTQALKQKVPFNSLLLGISEMEDDEIQSIIQEILSIKPEIKVVTVGNRDDENAAVESVRYGANGYVLLPVKADELLTTLRQVNR